MLLALDKIDDTNYKVINYFSDDTKIKCSFAYKNKKRHFAVPRCFVLNEDAFSLLDNIDYDMVYNDILSSQTSDELKKYTYFFVQDMIAGYSKRIKEKNLLCNCIEKSLCFLKENVPDFGYEDLWENFMNECADKAKNII